MCRGAWGHGDETLKALVALALAALVPAGPALAADLSTIGCVDAKLPITARAQLLLDIERNLTESGKKHSFDPGVVQALKAAAELCATDNGWSQAAIEPAVQYTRARLGWPVAQRLASERGLDPAVMESVWGTLPEEQRNAPLTVDSYRELADAAIPEGDQRTAEMGEFVVEFFSMLSVMQYSTFEFSKA